MKLKDIVPYCLDYAKRPGSGWYDMKYYWVIKGLTYQMHSLLPDNLIILNRLSKSNKDDSLTLNLNNEITIFDKFIMVHKTDNQTTDSENDLFFKTNYYIANGHDFSAQMYNLALYNDGIITNLRAIFKDLIEPPVPPQPAELTLDEKVDNLIDDLMKDSKTMAIKKLKRMLNERI
ncbi:hypothetical protein EBS40_02915 [bacterium]|nr:hypothetical protein [bacterium]